MNRVGGEGQRRMGDEDACRKEVGTGRGKEARKCGKTKHCVYRVSGVLK